MNARSPFPSIFSPQGRVAIAGVLLALAPAPRAQCGEEVRLNYLDGGGTQLVLRTPLGAPVLGGDFAFRIDGGLPGALGVLLYSGFENPIYVPELDTVVWPEAPWFTWYFGIAPNGSSPLVLHTPEVTDDLCGAQATFQAFVFDGGAPGGLRTSDAVRLRVGDVTAPLYWTPSVIPVAGEPVAVELGDVTGDRLPDLVTVERSPDAIVVRPALRGGGFGAPVTTPLTGVGPASLDLAFLDGDAHLDAVVANAGTPDPNAADDFVSVLLGDGLGGFTETQYAAGKGARATAIADLDEDGFLDIAVANSEDSRLSVLHGDGAGAFGPALQLFAGSGPSGSGPWDVEIADVNEDGDLDLVAPLLFGEAVTVVLGAGIHGFLPAMTTATSALPESVALGDLNGDGHADLALTFFDVSRVSVLFGAGDGTFGPEIDLGLALNVPRVAIADVDGDPYGDLVAVSGSALGVILRGNAAGTFEPGRSFLKPTLLSSLAIGDVGGNGQPDLVMGRISGTSASVSLVALRSDGTTDGVEAFEGTGALDGSIADLDGDGDGDLVLVVGGGSRVLRTFLVAPDGTPTLLPDSYVVNGNRVLVADFDGDGIPDALGHGFGSAGTSWLGLGDGTFGTSAAVAGAPRDALARDMDEDGDLDLVGTSLPELRVLLGNGDGTFAAPLVTSPPGTPSDFDSFDVGLVDGDAHLDIVIGDGDGNVVLYRGNGDGTLAAPVPVGLLAGGIDQTLLGDLDGDGDLDAVLEPGNAFQPIHVLLGNGDGTFGAPIPTVVLANFQLVDLDGDSKLDLIDSLARVARGNGDGTFAAPVRYLDVDINFSPFPAVGNVDIDGIPDLLLPLSDTLVLAPSLVGE